MRHAFLRILRRVYANQPDTYAYSTNWIPILTLLEIYYAYSNCVAMVGDGEWCQAYHFVVADLKK